MRKKDLELIIETIPVYRKPKIFLEQYPTPGDVASDVIWEVFMREDVTSNVVFDLGAGTGRLGLGISLLGAKYVILIDVDVDCLRDALKWSRDNNLINVDFIVGDARMLPIRSTVKGIVIQNPPFGIRSKITDADFLKSAFSIARVVYSLHRMHERSRIYIKNLALSFGFNAKLIKTYSFRIPQIYKEHYRRVYYIEADLWRFERINYV